MDAAFKSAPYAAYTTKQLETFIAADRGNDVMIAEVARRHKVASGDYTASTEAERLRKVDKS